MQCSITTLYDVKLLQYYTECQFSPISCLRHMHESFKAGIGGWLSVASGAQLLSETWITTGSSIYRYYGYVTHGAPFNTLLML